MNKYVKKILLGLLVALIGIQFIRSEKNVSGESKNDFTAKYPVPADVMSVLQAACMDCHSNTTRYPWYAEVQPVGMWLAGHIKNGKRKLNFSEFTNLPLAVQNHKLEEIMEVMEEKTMPLKSYTWTHKDAVLTEEQSKQIVSWAQAMMDSLRQQYPADSLVLQSRRK